MYSFKVVVYSIKFAILLYHKVACSPLHLSRGKILLFRFMNEEIKVAKETRDRYNGVALPVAEMSVLKEFEELLWNNGYLHEGEAIPVVLQDKIARNESKIGFYAENNAVVALSVRYCAVTSLPASLGQLTNLQHLDLTGNQIISLPPSLGNLVQLKKLYLDDNQITSLPPALGNLINLEEIHLDGNQLASLPAWLQRLEQRGCTVFK
jgi:Leucine Rich repeats (2 copies)/Leucine Rich Repeat